MGFFDVFSTALGFMALDELGKEKARERKKQELVDGLLRNAALYGVEYTEEESQKFIANSERLGLLD